MECTSGHVVHLRITLHVIIWGGDCIPGYAGCIPRSKCLLLFLRKKNHGISNYAKIAQKTTPLPFFTKGFSKPFRVNEKKQTHRPRNTRPLHSQVWQLLLTSPIAVKGNSWVHQWWHREKVVEKNGVIRRFFTFFGFGCFGYLSFPVIKSMPCAHSSHHGMSFFQVKKVKKFHQTNDFWIFGVLFLSLDRVTLLWHATWDSSKSSLDTR